MDDTKPSSVYWYSLKDPAPSEPLPGDIQTDVLVIGGGMAGLAAAQKLQELGREVVLIERDFCGAGASGKSSGFITPDSEIELSALLSTYGPAKARRMWEFVLSGVDLIRTNIAHHTIACDYQVQDSFFIANTAATLRYIQAEHDARQALGYESTLYDRATVQDMVGSTAYAGAVRYPDTYGISAYLYCQAMCDVLRSKGVSIYEQTSAVRIEGHEVVTATGRITAESILVCADRFIPELGALEQEIYHFQNLLGITKPLTPEQVHALFPADSLMVWDTELIYNYFRLTGDNRLLIGGGDLRYSYARSISKDTNRIEQRLTSYIAKTFPSLEIEMDSLWPGMLGVSKDLLPVIGPDNQNDCVYYVGAATGLPWAAALGTYAVDHILNGRTEFDDDFASTRQFVIGGTVQSVLGTPLTFALSHGIAKYL